MQGAFSELDGNLGWNDFALRNYDPQTGRFVQQDPFQQFSSPYVGMGNDPVNMIDPSGGIGIPCPGTSALSIFLDNAVYAVGNAFNSVSNVIAVAGRISSVTTTSMSMVNAVNTSKIINGQINTLPVGEIEANKAYNGTISEEDNNEINTNKNVMIFILTEQEYKRWNPALNKNDDLHKEWDIIYATNIVDATRFFKSKYGSEKVNNLLFITHGNEGGIVYSFKGQARGINSKEMNQYANGEGAKLESNDLTAIEKLKYLVGQVKNGGNFVLGRCASSDGIQSEGFLRGLNNVATNPINLISNKAKITRPLHWDNKFGYYGPSWNSSNGKIWIQIDYNNKIHRNLDLKYNRDQEPAIFYN